jgi:DnaK suppressor protein
VVKALVLAITQKPWGGTMDDLRGRLDQDLKAVVSRLRHPGGAAVIEDLPWTIRDSYPFADEVDGIQANESREIGLATRELLLERVNRLSAALDRMSAGGYGTCVECGQAISAARLHATPEVQTCVRCQDGIERAGLLMDWSRRSVFAASEDGEMVAASQASTRAPHLPSGDDGDVRVPGILRAATTF